MDSPLAALNKRLETLEAKLRPLRIRRSTPSPRLGGAPAFLDAPVPVQSSTTTAVTWTAFDTTGVVATSARVVVLECEYALSGPDAGDVDAHVRIRRDPNSASLVLARGRASGSADNIAGVNQAWFPLSANGTFEFTIEAPGFNGGCQIRLIGYL